MHELARIDPAAPFYASLLIEDTELREALLVEALKAPSPYVRIASAKILMPLLIESGRHNEAARLLQNAIKRNERQLWPQDMITRTQFLQGRYNDVIQEYAESELTNMQAADKALYAAARIMEAGDTQTAMELTKHYFLVEAVDTDYIWVYEHIQEHPGQIIDNTLQTAISGRIAVFKRAYGPALLLLESVKALDKDLFIEYGELLSDLGRAYQYGGKAAEGSRIFSDWVAQLSDNDNNNRFRLLFYAGRMQNQLQEHRNALQFFKEALVYAPDPVQKDATIWYILDILHGSSLQETVDQLKILAPQWQDASSFSGFLDRLSGSLIARGLWDQYRELFSRIHPFMDSTSKARYAYILGRAQDEDLLQKETEPSSYYFRIAYEQDKASFYYRSLASAALNEQLIPYRSDSDTQAAKNTLVLHADQSDEDSLLHFLLDFISYGCVEFMHAYVQDALRELQTDEIRSIAAALATHEQWGPSIRIAAMLQSKPDYIPNRDDLSILYPQPFITEVEAAAALYTIPKELFYGLIRTESAFIPDVVSWAGAVGLAQIMPATADDVAGRIARQGGPDFLSDGTIKLEDPSVNTHIGAWYYSHLTERTGSPMLALASYNGGITRVRRWRSDVPGLPEDMFLETIPIPETREYSRKVLAAATVYGYLYYGMTMDAVVADIFPGD